MSACIDARGRLVRVDVMSSSSTAWQHVSLAIRDDAYVASRGSKHYAPLSCLREPPLCITLGSLYPNGKSFPKSVREAPSDLQKQPRPSAPCALSVETQPFERSLRTLWRSLRSLLPGPRLLPWCCTPPRCAMCVGVAGGSQRGGGEGRIYALLMLYAPVLSCSTVSTSLSDTSWGCRCC